VRDSNYWIGGHRRFDNGGWCWGDDHIPVGASQWYRREPNNKGGDENCMEMLNRRKYMRWNDEDCTDKEFFICEMEKP